MDKPDLVERRLRYIQRQIALDKSAVNVAFSGSGRRAAGRRTVTGCRSCRSASTKSRTGRCSISANSRTLRSTTWKLEIGGLVENPVTLTWEQFLALPQADDVSDFHCVTTWSRFDNHWRGVRFKTIAELAVPKDAAHSCCAPATTSCPARYIPYTTNLPLARAVEDDVLLVHTWEGEPLPREHGGPCRMITPKLYAWKGAKWIRKIEFLAEDHKGFWEVRGYSNSAEPWFNDRVQHWEATVGLGDWGLGLRSPSPGLPAQARCRACRLGASCQEPSRLADFCGERSRGIYSGACST